MRFRELILRHILLGLSNATVLVDMHTCSCSLACWSQFTPRMHACCLATLLFSIKIGKTGAESVTASAVSQLAPTRIPIAVNNQEQVSGSPDGPGRIRHACPKASLPLTKVFLFAVTPHQASFSLFSPALHRTPSLYLSTQTLTSASLALSAYPLPASPDTCATHPRAQPGVNP